MNIKNSGSKYRMPGKDLLPKFGKKNPFATDAAADTPAGAPPVAARPVNEHAIWKMSPAEIRAAKLKETKRLPTAKSVAPAPVPEIPAAAAAASTASGSKRDFSVFGVCRMLVGFCGPRVKTVFGWLAGRAGKWNPLAWWRGRRPAVKPVLAKPDQAPVQGELSLDNVRVVRNDLSEADVEVVPAKPAVKSKPAAASVSAPEAAPAPVTEEVELIKT